MRKLAAEACSTNGTRVAHGGLEQEWARAGWITPPEMAAGRQIKCKLAYFMHGKGAAN